jgi:hypothetical protein
MTQTAIGRLFRRGDTDGGGRSRRAKAADEEFGDFSHLRETDNDDDTQGGGGKP